MITDTTYELTAYNKRNRATAWTTTPRDGEPRRRAAKFADEVNAWRVVVKCAEIPSELFVYQVGVAGVLHELSLDDALHEHSDQAGANCSTRLGCYPAPDNALAQSHDLGNMPAEARREFAYWLETNDLW